VAEPVLRQFHAVRPRLRQRAGPAELQQPETEIVHPLCKTPYLRFSDGKTAAADL